MRRRPTRSRTPSVRCRGSRCPPATSSGGALRKLFEVEPQAASVDNSNQEGQMLTREGAACSARAQLPEGRAEGEDAQGDGEGEAGPRQGEGQVQQAARGPTPSRSASRRPRRWRICGPLSCASCATSSQSRRWARRRRPRSTPRTRSSPRQSARSTRCRRRPSTACVSSTRRRRLSRRRRGGLPLV